MNTNDQIKSITIQMLVNNKPLAMKHETGSSISVNPGKNYTPIFHDFKLLPTLVRLKTYDF